MSTAQQLIDMAQSLLMDADAAVWSEPQLLSAFNEMQTDFGLRTLCYVQEASQVITVPTADPPEYSLPGDCVDADRVESANWGPSRIERATTRDLDLSSSEWELATGPTVSAYVTDRRQTKVIRVWPRPTVADTLQYRYFAVPASLSSAASTSALPSWAHHYLLFGMVATAAGSESEMQDAKKAQHCAERYWAGVELIRRLLA